MTMANERDFFTKIQSTTKNPVVFIPIEVDKETGKLAVLLSNEVSVVQ